MKLNVEQARREQVAPVSGASKLLLRAQGVRRRRGAGKRQEGRGKETLRLFGGADQTQV